MASRGEGEEEEKDRRKTIPVLRVVKKKGILKNIFMMNKNCKEHSVVVGRHPDCNIVVTHPSISRFHLLIRSKPSSRILSLLDLSSVHGTWVNGRKLQPRESVDLKQGDTFTLGVSTRVYHLHWVQQEQEQIVKELSFCTVGNREIPSVDSIPECNNSFLPDVNLELTSEKEIPLPQDMVSFCCDEDRKNHLKDETFGLLNGRPFGTQTSCFPANSDIECQSRVLAPPYVQSVDDKEKTQACPEVEMPGESNLFCTLREYLTENICLPVVEAVQGIKMQQFPDTLKQEASLQENQSSLVTNIDPETFDEKHDAAAPVIPKESDFGCRAGDNDKVEDILNTRARIFNSENTCLLVGEVIAESKFRQIKSVEEVSVDSLSDGEKQDKCIGEYKSKLQDLNAKSCHVQGPSLDEIVEDIGSRCTCIKSTVSASCDAKGVAAVTVLPRESEFGCTLGDNDRIEDILTGGARIFNSENTCLLVGEVIAESKFRQIKSVEEVSVDSLSDGEKQDKCIGEYKSKLQDLNAKSCHVQGPSLDEIVEDIGSRCTCIKSTVSASCDAKGVAAVTVLPRESEFGCTLGDNDRIEDILTSGARIFNSENTSFLVKEAIPVTKFQQIKIVEEVAVDSISDGEKQDSCGEEFESKLQTHLNAKYCHDQGNSLYEIVEDTGKKCAGSICPIPLEAILKVTDEKENQTLQSLIAVAGCYEIEIPECRVEAKENGKYCHEQGHPLDETVEDIGNNCTGSIRPIPVLVESVNSPVPREADSKITNKKENQTPQSLISMAGCSEMEILESLVEATESAKYCHEQGHPLDERVEDIGSNCTGSICPISVLVESVNSVVPQEADLKFTNKKENQSPQSPIALAGCSEMEVLESHLEATEKSSTFGNIWSRRGKAASAPQARTRKSRFMSTSNVDTEVERGNEKDIINKSMPKELFSVLDEEEEEIFTPNKENFSPNTLHLRFMRKKGKLEEIKHSKSQWSHNSKANFNFSPNIYSDEGISAISNKDNQTLKVAQEQKQRRKPLACHMNLAQEQDIIDMKQNRVERIPFQSVISSGGKRKSGTSGPVSAAKNIDASNCGQISDKCTKPSHMSGGQKRSWVMVVDAASLLNKESRKALQLLQGLKGTRLIIPKLVIRELEYMKQRQFRIFRRISQASLALEWIEECMESTKWWIHIQSSMEEPRLIAPTPPPASPRTQFVEESWAFPGLKSSKEIASPTVEDHILDCALLYRRKENDGHLVLLSDDISLKIKSMAEGLLCETVHGFRQSLVNPFSKRFMWANSSPRGLTWSCQDDVVLREKYCGLPSKAGLKFITQQFLYFRV